MPRILRTIPSYFPLVSGPANQARAISQGLAPLGYHSTVVTTTLGAAHAPRHEQRDGIAIQRLATQGGVMQYQLALGASSAFGRIPADLVHAHSYRNFLADAAALHARWRNIPFILHLHGTLAGYRQIAPRERWWLYRAYDYADRVFPTLHADRFIVSTEEEARETEAYGIDRRLIRVIPMGITPSDYAFADVQRDAVSIVFVGRLTEDRNPALLLQALGQLSELPWNCTLVGDETRRSFATEYGYVDKLKRMAQNLGIAGRIHFAGQLHGEQLRQAYARAGIFVYPSRYENFGQTILEAAAAGCALVTTPVGVAHELVRDGATGFLINSDDPAALAQQLRWLLDRPAQQRAMGERAGELVRAEFAWEPIMQRYVELYSEVLDARRRSSSSIRAAAAEQEVLG